MADDLRLRRQFEMAVLLDASPWADFVLCSQLVSKVIPWREAALRSAPKREGAGYRNEHSRGYWPRGKTPDEMLRALVDEEDPREARLRHTRLFRYTYRLVNGKLGLLDEELAGVSPLEAPLIETAVWWTARHGDPPRVGDFERHPTLLPPVEIVRAVFPPPTRVVCASVSVTVLHERALVASRGDAPHLR